MGKHKTKNNHGLIMNKDKRKKRSRRRIVRQNRGMDKKQLRQQLLTERGQLANRMALSENLQTVMRIWLTERSETVIGAYWPIKAEFDALPALHRWREDGELLLQPQPRRIGLPVIDKQTKTLSFWSWYPGCPMEEDAYGIPKPKDTELIVPTLLFVPCVGYSDRGVRLGYGGGFYDRTLAELSPRPYTVGLSYSFGYVPGLSAEQHDVPLDAILTDLGLQKN
jgi:5-formyltetrahydrofolate cyclo-ligase